MTFFADLCDLELRFSDRHMCTDGQIFEIDTFCEDILGEITRLQNCALFAHLVNAFVGKQTDLTVPISRVSVADDTVILFAAAEKKIRAIFIYSYY